MLPALVGPLLMTSLLWLGSGPPTLPAVPGEVPEAAPLDEAPAETDVESPSEEPALGAPVVVEPPPPVVAGPAPVQDPERAPVAREDWHDSKSDWVTVRAPRWRGTGLWVGAGLAMGGAFTFQLVDALLCGSCAYGLVERVMLGASMGLSAGGGVVRGRADAYDDTVLRRDRPDTRRTLIIGTALAGAGVVLGLVNEGMWWRCVIADAGPYRVEADDFRSFNCRYGLNRGLVDLASASTATGLGLLTWSLNYRRTAKGLERARVVGLRPALGRDRWGVSLGGRF